MPLLVTSFGSSQLHALGDKPPPPSPGEEEGKDGGTAEHLAALQKRLRASEQTICKLQEEVAALRSFESDFHKVQLENQELRAQIAAAAHSRRPADEEAHGFGFELEEKERLADRLSELEHEKIVLTGMYRSATKRCQMLEQRLVARTQAALTLAIEGGKGAVPAAQPERGDRSVNVFEEENEGANGECCEAEGLWNAPEEEETREDDRWRRGDWGDGRLIISDLPLEQCRQLVTVSENKLRVEDWVIRHACKFQQQHYRHEPELEGGSDTSSVHSSSSSHCGGLLSITTSADSRRRMQDLGDTAESEVKQAGVGEVTQRKMPSSSLKHEFTGYSASQTMQVRANPMTGGVTRAAWKTPRLQPESQVQGIFNSLLGGATGVSNSPPNRVSASVVQFAT